jgi:hypothetical protein
MTLYQCCRISFLRSFIVRNVECAWVRYPAVMKLWIFHVLSAHSRAGMDAFKLKHPMRLNGNHDV